MPVLAHTPQKIGPIPGLKKMLQRGTFAGGGSWLGFLDTYRTLCVTCAIDAVIGGRRQVA
jgi:hypothetical protein